MAACWYQSLLLPVWSGLDLFYFPWLCLFLQPGCFVLTFVRYHYIIWFLAIIYRSKNIYCSWIVTYEAIQMAILQSIIYNNTSMHTSSYIPLWICMFTHMYYLNILITKIICKSKLIVVWPLFVCTSVYIKQNEAKQQLIWTCILS